MDTHALWQDRLPEELAFWDAWLASRGACYGCDPDEFRARFDPTTPLQENLRALIDAPEGATVRILDVGAGPATVLGSQWTGRQLVILAVDPLAMRYDELLRKYNCRPPFRTWLSEGELPAPADLFDLAYARNSLDHSHDPWRAVYNMYDAVRPGGVIYLLHHDHEADRRNAKGLHQWNFYPNGDVYVMEHASTHQQHILVYRNRMTMRAIGDQTEVIIRKPHA